MKWTTTSYFGSIRARQLPTVLALVLLGAVGALPARAASPPPAEDVITPLQECRYSAWSDLQDVGPLRTKEILSVLSIAADRYIVGNPLPQQFVGGFANLSVRKQPFEAWTLSGESIGKPGGEFWFLSPRSTIDSAGRLHVLWGEPAPVDSLTYSRFRGAAAKQLWYSMYDTASGWSEPQLIYDVGMRGRLLWNVGGSLAITSTGDLHSSVGMQGPSGLLHLAGSAGAWRVDTIPVSVPSYTDVTVGPGRDLYVVAVGKYGSPPGPANNIVLVRSNDMGSRWEVPVEVSALGERRATRPGVHAGPDGSIHLIWGQNLTGGLSPEVVRHTVSRDQGRSWSEPQDLVLPQSSLVTWATAVDRCGNLHLVYRVPDGPRSEVLYSRWEGAWSRPVAPWPTLTNFRDLALDATSDGTKILLFGSEDMAPANPSSPAFQLKVAELRIAQ